MARAQRDGQCSGWSPCVSVLLAQRGIRALRPTFTSKFCRWIQAQRSCIVQWWLLDKRLNARRRWSTRRSPSWYWNAGEGRRTTTVLIATKPREFRALLNGRDEERL